MAVDRGTRHAELGSDLRDRVPALAVLADLVVHLARELNLPRPELRFLPARATARASSGKPVDRALRHQRMLELRDRADDLKEQTPDGGGRVDPLVQHHEIDAAGVEEFGELDQVPERAAEAVELGDYELVADAVGAQQRLVQLWPCGELARRGVDKDLIAAGSRQPAARRPELRGSGRESRRPCVKTVSRRARVSSGFGHGHGPDPS